MVVFVEQQQGSRLLPPILQIVENLVYVKVLTQNYVTVPTKLKVGCDPIFVAVGFKTRIGSNA